MDIRSTASKLLVTVIFLSMVIFLVEWNGVTLETIQVKGNDPEEIYRERRERMMKACVRTGVQGQLSMDYVNGHVLIDRKHHLAFCFVRKSASTFWRALFRIVNGNGQSKSPFDKYVKDNVHFESLNIIPRKETEDFMKMSLSFLVVRNPYTRLFSAYVDKIFVTAPWSCSHDNSTRPTQNLPNSTEEHNCTRIVTFKEFVKDVIHQVRFGPELNSHFVPVTTFCAPCQHKYEIIAKMETLEEDTVYLLDKIGKQELKQSLKLHFKESHFNATIRNRAKWLFDVKTRRTYCCKWNFYDAQRVMWKSLQIRGILSRDSKYPVSKYVSEMITEEQFTDFAIRGIGNAVQTEVSQRNKDEVMLEAYSAVDRKDMEKLYKLFRRDCEMFGYACRPDNLFKIEKHVKPWYFDINTA